MPQADGVGDHEAALRGRDEVDLSDRVVAGVATVALGGLDGASRAFLAATLRRIELAVREQLFELEVLWGDEHAQRAGRTQAPPAIRRW